jgi:hypothetical protein
MQFIRYCISNKVLYWLYIFAGRDSERRQIGIWPSAAYSTFFPTKCAISSRKNETTDTSKVDETVHKLERA